MNDIAERLTRAERDQSFANVLPKDAATLILVLGIVSILCCGLLAGIPAIILGRSALSEIDANPAQYGGRSMVNAGYICGIIGTALSVLGILANIIIYAS